MRREKKNVVAPEKPHLHNHLVQGLNRKWVRAFPETTTPTSRASAVTIKEEQIHFGCGGHGLAQNNQGKCARQQWDADGLTLV